MTFLSKLFPISCALCEKGNESLCVNCVLSLKKSEKVSDQDISLFSYKDDRVRAVLQKAKYSHLFSLYKPLVYGVRDVLPEHFTEKDTLIIPMPMHRMRKLFRGQNHTEHIARYLGEVVSLPVEIHILTKHKYTKRQALLPKGERLHNQKNSFSCHEKYAHLLQGKKVLLVDDITTTGSTLSEAKTVLLKHGAQEVFTITLAH